jgi:hypothetical protein
VWTGLAGSKHFADPLRVRLVEHQVAFALQVALYFGSKHVQRLLEASGSTCLGAGAIDGQVELADQHLFAGIFEKASAALARAMLMSSLVMSNSYSERRMSKSG